jgi:hypothetical protein
MRQTIADDALIRCQMALAGVAAFAALNRYMHDLRNGVNPGEASTTALHQLAVVLREQGQLDVAAQIFHALSRDFRDEVMN